MSARDDNMKKIANYFAKFFWGIIVQFAFILSANVLTAAYKAGGSVLLHKNIIFMPKEDLSTST